MAQQSVDSGVNASSVLTPIWQLVDRLQRCHVLETLTKLQHKNVVVVHHARKCRQRNTSVDAMEYEAPSLTLWWCYLVIIRDAFFNIDKMTRMQHSARKTINKVVSLSFAAPYLARCCSWVVGTRKVSLFTAATARTRQVNEDAFNYLFNDHLSRKCELSVLIKSKAPQRTSSRCLPLHQRADVADWRDSETGHNEEMNECRVTVFTCSNVGSMRLYTANTQTLLNVAPTFNFVMSLT